MSVLRSSFKLTLIWVLLVAFATLSTSRSDAATFNIVPLDPSGNSITSGTISGSLVNPTTLEFVLTLGGIPLTGVNGFAAVDVFNTSGNVTSFFALGNVFAGDPDTTLTGSPFGPPGSFTSGALSPVTRFLVDVTNGDLPLLVQVVLSLSDAVSGKPFAGVLDLTVELPPGLVGVNQTPLPGTLLLFASGLGVLLARTRRRTAATPLRAE